MKTQIKIRIMFVVFVLLGILVAETYSCESVIVDMQEYNKCDCSPNTNTCIGADVITFEYGCGNSDCCPGENCETVGYSNGPYMMWYHCIGDCTIPYYEGQCALNLDTPIYEMGEFINDCACR